MGLSKRGTRTLRHAGQVYRWGETSHGGLNALIVQVNAGRGQKLVVELPWAHFMEVKPVQRPLLPGWVTTCIAAALERGFTPTKKGPDFVITLADLLPHAPWPLDSRELRARLRPRKA